MFFKSIFPGTQKEQRCSVSIVQLVFSLFQGQPLHAFSLGVGSRLPWALTCYWFFVKERLPPLNISVCKNGQLFPNRFSGKRTIPWPNKFEKTYLMYLPSWRVIKHINILKIWVALPSVWPWKMFCFAANITIKETDFWTTDNEIFLNGFTSD